MTEDRVCVLRTLQLLVYIPQSQWFIYKKKILPAVLLNSHFDCMVNFTQGNKSNNGYLGHVGCFKKSDCNTTQS